MRVALVDPLAYTPPYDHELAAALARRGHEVTLLTSPFLHGDAPAPDGYAREELFLPLSSRLLARSPRSRLRRAVKALEYGRLVGASIVGIVGRDGGHTAKVADACVVVPTVNPATVTPHSEAFQAVVWHLLVSHPKLKAAATKWESTR
jgi:hypothetical protein